MIWFLHSYEPAIVVTTAPSVRQVRRLWQRIRAIIRNSKVPLMTKGLRPVNCYWEIGEEWYAEGVATTDGEKFRGDHGPNMLFIFDEANGVPSFAYEEVVNMCTAPNNKIVLVGNPTNPVGEFFDAFNKPRLGWKTMEICSMDHPNVTTGKQIFPGAVSRAWVNERVHKLCTPVDARDIDKKKNDFQWPKGSSNWYRPGPAFYSRVLGQFPTEGPDQLIPVGWLVNARNDKRPLYQIDETAPVDIGVDVAYSGGDYCVAYARRGPCVIDRIKWQGLDPEHAKGRVAEFIEEFATNRKIPVGSVAVDAIGIGAGLAYGLMGMRDSGTIHCNQVLAVQVSERATKRADDAEYENKRAEIAFDLAERFRSGRVDLSRITDDAYDDLEAQCTQIERQRSPQSLRHKIESKDSIRKKTGISPDDFDALCLCFIDNADTFAEHFASLIVAR